MQEIKYIDKIIKKKINNFEVNPQMNWSSFNLKFVENNLSSGILLNPKRNYISKLNVGLSVVALSMLSVFLLPNLIQNNSLPCLTPALKLLQKNIAIAAESVNKINHENLNILNNPLNFEDSVTLKNKNVIIRVEIPITKTIEIKKSVLLNDSIKNK